MMTVTDNEFIAIISRLPLAKEEAMKVAIYFKERGVSVEELDKLYLNKDDKLDLSSKIDGLEIRLNNKLDSHFRWLLGIIITVLFALFGAAFAIIRVWQ